MGSRNVPRRGKGLGHYVMCALQLRTKNASWELNRKMGGGMRSSRGLISQRRKRRLGKIHHSKGDKFSGGSFVSYRKN